jgi:hypothetical protein
MIYRAPLIDDVWLTEGVLTRRVFAWLIDALLIGRSSPPSLFGLADAGLAAALGVLPFAPR